MKLSRIALIVAPITLALSATMATASSQAVTATSASAIPTTPPPALLSQQLSWAECYPGDGLPQLQCANVTVPRDWAKPSGRTIEIEISRIKAADPAKRKGVLFTNPGGPGSPGIGLSLFIPDADPTIAASFDLIDMDTRGSGTADPALSCADPSILNTLYNLDGRDLSLANQLKTLQLTKKYATTCSGDALTPVINDAQIIRDMDLVRALLGETKINYLGFSGGTQLGAWYASVFPNRVGRFVLDGNIDWTSQTYLSFARQPAAFQDDFDNFLEPWIAAANSTYGLGATAKAVDQSYEKTRAALAKHPLTLDDGSIVTASAYDSGIVSSLYYSPNYSDIASAMAAVQNYATATSDEKAAAADFFESDPAAGDDPFWAIVCQDDQRPTFAQTETDFLRFLKPYPLVGAGWNEQECPFFTTPVVGSPVQPSKLPPLLMLNNSDDPATPLAGAQLARAHTPNARLVTVLHQSGHTIYGYGDTCADGYANNWLLNGVLPAKDTTCPGIPLPVLTPSTSASASTNTPVYRASTKPALTSVRGPLSRTSLG